MRLPDESEIAYLKSIVDESGDPFLRLALASFMAGDARIVELKKAAENSPDNLRIHLAIAEAILRDPSRDVEFTEAIQEARRIDPTNAYPDYLEAMRLAGGGNPEEAMQAIATAVEKGHFDPLRGTDLAAREELLMLGGYSEGPRLAITFLGLLFPVDPRRLPEALWDHASQLVQTG